MTSPYFFRNDKTNAPAPIPPPERGWTAMDVLAWAIIAIGLLSVIWQVYQT